MFHLLVAYGGWAEGGGSLSTSRVYIRQDNPAQRQFLNADGVLNVHKIREIPALLVPETGSDDMQLCRVAYITNVVQSGKETEIEYSIDNSIRPIANEDLESFSTQLRLGRFGLTHTCWSICDADLFKILLLNEQRSVLSPSVFSIEQNGRRNENLVSVMMPFSAEFNTVYSCLQEAVAAVGMACLRADDFWEHHTIIQDIVSLIVRAKIVICDCSGRNPNVFYEAGIAHTLGKEVILITQNGDDVPFDLRHHRYVSYLNNSEGLSVLSQRVQDRLKTLASPE
ncbi:MAG: hypothetical protein KDI61_00510 [Alphaproteobacteria bacterium]|nr:hypothetical protein [Alphaproteobacteria bacterium]